MTYLSGCFSSGCCDVSSSAGSVSRMTNTALGGAYIPVTMQSPSAT